MRHGASMSDSSARSVGKILHPRLARERNVILLKAYLDASGITNQPVIALAGLAATESAWDCWEVQWLDKLKELGLTRWHHTDFYNRRNEYRNWEPAKFNYAYAQICKILNSIRPFGIAIALKRSDYEDLWKMGKWNIPPDPYLWCIDHCLEALIHKLHEAPADEGISIYIDKDNDEYEKLGQCIADWHLAQNHSRRVSITYGYNIDYKPLQAADILANETYRYIQAGQGVPLGLYNSITDNSWLNMSLYAKPLLEMEFEAKALRN